MFSIVSDIVLCVVVVVLGLEMAWLCGVGVGWGCVGVCVGGGVFVYFRI